MIYLNNFFLFLTNMDKNSKFLLTMIAIIIILLIIIIVISALSKNKEEEMLKARKQVPTDKEMIKEKLKKLDFQLEQKQEKTEVEKIEPKKEEAPIPEVEEEIEIIDFDYDKDNEIENISKLIEDRDENPFNLNEFEQEQEKSAIISYDELVKRAGAKKIVYKKSEKPILDEIKEEKKSSFKPTQIISPIYGTKSTEVKVNKVTREEKFESYKTGDNEIDDDIEFLNKLKKFRRELQ